QMRAGGVLAGRDGRFTFRSTSALDELLPETPREASRIKAEQSNTSVVYAGRAILKVFRKLQPGPNPELEITELLTRHTTFRAAPRLGGAIEYEAVGKEAITLATLHEFVANQGDAWTHVQARLGEYFAAAMTGTEGSGASAIARGLVSGDARDA